MIYILTHFSNGKSRACEALHFSIFFIFILYIIYLLCIFLDLYSIKNLFIWYVLYSNALANATATSDWITS